MHRRSFKLVAIVLAFCAAAAHARPLALQATPAPRTPAAQTSTLLAAALAGPRIVAVGQHGVVLLSDDQGKNYRQALSVPIAATLTGVYFADSQQGWAVGHWGAILHTSDGGENWTLQRFDLQQDQPLFSVYFRDQQHGWAAGLWSLLLVTDDGGATWSRVPLPSPPGKQKADLNLFQLFPTGGNGLAIAAERGQILHSADAGRTWRYVDTGSKASLWSGMVLADGSWLAGGLRGKLLRSADQGAHWTPVATGSQRSVTGLVAAGGRQVVAVGLDGMMLFSQDNGSTFGPGPAKYLQGINAVVVSAGKVLGFTDSGPLPPQPINLP